jgi:hypothetical protein
MKERQRVRHGKREYSISAHFVIVFHNGSLQLGRIDPGDEIFHMSDNSS